MKHILYFETRAAINNIKQNAKLFVLPIFTLALSISSCAFFLITTLSVQSLNSPTLDNKQTIYSVEFQSSQSQKLLIEQSLIDRLRATEFGAIHQFFTLNNSRLSAIYGDYQALLNAEIIHFDAISQFEIFSDISDQNILNKIESNRQNSVILSHQGKIKLENSGIPVAKGGQINLQGDIFTIVAILPPEFRSITNQENNTDIILPWHSLSAAKNVPQGLFNDNDFGFTDTSLHLIGKNDITLIDSEIFWLESLLISEGIQLRNDEFMLVEGIQRNIKQYNNQKQLLIMNLFACIVLLIIGGFNYVKFQITQTIRQKDNFITRFSLGASIKIVCTSVFLQNAIVFLITLFIAMLFFGAVVLLFSGSEHLTNTSIQYLKVLTFFPAYIIIFVCASLAQFSLIQNFSRKNLNLHLLNKTEIHDRFLAGASALVGVIVLALSLSLLLEQIKYQSIEYGYNSQNKYSLILKKPNSISGSVLYASPDYQEFYERTKQVESSFGVQLAFSDQAFFDNSSGSPLPFYLPNQRGALNEIYVKVSHISPNYFNVLHIDSVRNNKFMMHSDDEVIVNMAFAEKFLSNDVTPSIIYRELFSLEIGDNGKSKLSNKSKKQYRVIDVVNNFYAGSKREDIEPTIYFPLKYQSDIANIVVANSYNKVKSEILNSLQKLDLNNNISQFEKLEFLQEQDEIAEKTTLLILLLAAVLSTLTFFLTVISNVHQLFEIKKRDIFIHYAVGAEPKNILGLIIKDSYLDQLIGACFGAILMLFASPYFEFAIPKPSGIIILVSFFIMTLIFIISICYATLKYNSAQSFQPQNI